MTSSSVASQDARRARLQQLAAEWGIHQPSPVIPPLPAPVARTQQDDLEAEELLKRRRLSSSSGMERHSHGSLRRAFGSSKKTWEASEIFEALDNHIANRGSPGVADALIEKLKSAGGNINVLNVKSKTSIISRRRSLESLERSRVLQKAIENRQADMVALLVQYADEIALDNSLSYALRTTDPVMVQLLLARGANASQTDDAKNAFAELCAMGGYSDIVGLVLQSEGRPPPDWLSMCMVSAAKKGCLPTVLWLSRAAADGEYSKGEALKTAIEQCRVDIALAILTGAKPPISGGQAVTESFIQLFQKDTINPNEKLVLAEALLCAGASGDPVSAALVVACEAGFFDMVNLLLYYGASVDYQDASVIKSAIARGHTGLVMSMLNEHTPLSPVYASQCVESIPKNLLPEDRHTILSILLRKGAKGNPLSEALIDAVKASDLQSVQLLLTPHFAVGQTVSRQGSQSSHVSVAYISHDVASVDYKDGLALMIAVQMGNVAMVRQLLTGRPSTHTLDRVFPLIHHLPDPVRCHMAECLVPAGVSQSCISAVLQAAIEEQPPRRNEALIGLLLQNNADVDFNAGASILSAVVNQDLPLLETLLQSRPSIHTINGALLKAMELGDRLIRYQIIMRLLRARMGPIQPSAELAQAFIQLLSTKPVDSHLVALFLDHGVIDANYEQGLPVAIAAEDPEPALLELLLEKGKPNHDTLYRGLDLLTGTPGNSTKANKVHSILSRTTENGILDAILFKEVQTLLQTPPERQDLSILHSLLSAGADVNAHNAAALCCAVRAANEPIVDMLFSANPSPASLGRALPQALNILEPMDRLTFTQKLIEGGAPATEVNRALGFAVSALSNDRPLIALLAAYAESSDGKALARAVMSENPEIVQLILEKSPAKYSVAVLRTVFQHAMDLKNKDKRLAICTSLLKKGLSGPIVSDALLTAVEEGDIALGKVLVDFGADIDHQDGQAIVQACKSGSYAVLEMLLSSRAQVTKHTLVKGFQAVTNVKDLPTLERVFRLLLERGVDGEVVDAQLAAASRFGLDGEPLVRLLMQYGASPDFNYGEAVWNATRSAVFSTLKVMLGVELVSETQKRPGKETLLRSLKASKKLSRDARYQVIEWLFEAGLPPCEEIDITLNRAVKDEPDARLVRLLLDHGASPTANGCQTLIDAAQLMMVDILGMLLELEISEKDISWSFQQVFTPEAGETWMTERGFQVAELLLGKGAEGKALTLALATCIDAFDSEKDEVARKFARRLLQSPVDVNYEDGLVLQKAAQKGDAHLIQQLLNQKPSPLAVSLAFPYIFEAGLDESEVLRLIHVFADYRNGEDGLDTVFNHPSFMPILFHALDRFPRSVDILEALLNAGYYHDQVTRVRVTDEVEEEEFVTVLFWALLQPEKRVSSACIELLIERNAKVNFETDISKKTPLMLAVQHRRLDLVKTLILEGAVVDVMDSAGNTPLTMATQIGGEMGAALLGILLVAEPSINDGSLHNAARELDIAAMEALIKHGHEPDFPSPLHGGRSALGELCLNAGSTGEMNRERIKKMEQAIRFLIDHGSDPTIQCEGKTVLHLALHSANPVQTTTALLRAIWHDINKPCYLYSDGEYTYSPTQYVARVMPPSPLNQDLIKVLRMSRCKDVYYANDPTVPQPEGAVNLPEELLRAERERKAREYRIKKEEEDHKLALERTKEIAQLQNQIFLSRAELEDACARRRHENELATQRERQQIEEEAFAAELRRRKEEREAAIQHEHRLTEAGLTRARLIAEAEMELEEKKHEMALTWEMKQAAERERNAQQLSRLRIEERQAIERIEKAADERTIRRITEHKRLVDSQNVLATRLAAGGLDQRKQIGYVTGELD